MLFLHFLQMSTVDFFHRHNIEPQRLQLDPSSTCIIPIWAVQDTVLEGHHCPSASCLTQARLQPPWEAAPTYIGLCDMICPCRTETHTAHSYLGLTSARAYWNLKRCIHFSRIFLYIRKWWFSVGSHNCPYPKLLLNSWMLCCFSIQSMQLVFNHCTWTYHTAMESQTQMVRVGRHLKDHLVPMGVHTFL